MLRESSIKKLILHLLDFADLAYYFAVYGIISHKQTRKINSKKYIIKLIIKPFTFD